MSSIYDALISQHNSIHRKTTARLRLNEYSGTSEYSIYEFQGECAVSKSYNYRIVFVCDDDIAVEDIVDTKAEMTLKDEQSLFVSRTIVGRIYAAHEYGSVAHKRMYEIELVSPLFYLSLNHRYEIYMDKSVLNIISEIIGRYDALLHLSIDVKADSQRYPKRHYTTQYAQSDLEFITMLCEEEGLTFVIDSSSANPYKITLCELSEHAKASDPIECSYNVHKHFSPSSQYQNYYDPTKPSTVIKAQSGAKASNSVLKDNSLTQQLRNDIQRYKVRDRIEKMEGSLSKDITRYATIDGQRDYAQGSRVYGVTNDFRIAEGHDVKLSDTKVFKDIEVIVLSIKDRGFFPNAVDEYVEEASDTVQYIAMFEAIPKDIIYRPPFTIQKPRIYGIQTAIVSGGDSKTPGHANEIDVNERGEIRVIMHFDPNRPTTCYAPLGTAYSGGGYGSQFLPRVNSEVILSYLNGDIDRPFIIGALNNGENGIAYGLPGNKTQTYIKTQTTPQYADSEGYNELLFEDKANQELLSLRAQKDYKLHALHDSMINIDNDQTEVVGHDESVTIGNNRTEKVGNDESITIGNNRTEAVGNDESIAIGNNRSETVGNNEDIAIGANRTTAIGSNCSTTIGSNNSTAIGSNSSTEIGGNRSLNIAGNFQESVMQNKSETVLIAKALTVGAGFQTTVGGAKNESVGLTSTEQVGIMKHMIVGQRFELVVGNSSIVLNSDGTIIIKGNEILIEGSKQVTINGQMVEIN